MIDRKDPVATIAYAANIPGRAIANAIRSTFAAPYAPTFLGQAIEMLQTW
jgi:hypothetical protein